MLNNAKKYNIFKNYALKNLIRKGKITKNITYYIYSMCTFTQCFFIL